MYSTFIRHTNEIDDKAGVRYVRSHFSEYTGNTGKMCVVAHFFPNARFRKLLDPFFDTTKLLVDCALSQGWYDLSDYYKLVETPTPETGHQEFMYLFEHHTQFLAIIARYRIEKNLV